MIRQQMWPVTYCSGECWLKLLYQCHRPPRLSETGRDKHSCLQLTVGSSVHTDRSLAKPSSSLALSPVWDKNYFNWQTYLPNFLVVELWYFCSLHPRKKYLTWTVYRITFYCEVRYACFSLCANQVLCLEAWTQLIHWLGSLKMSGTDKMKLLKNKLCGAMIVFAATLVMDNNCFHHALLPLSGECLHAIHILWASLLIQPKAEENMKHHLFSSVL